MSKVLALFPPWRAKATSLGLSTINRDVIGTASVRFSKGSVSASSSACRLCLVL